MEIKYKKTAEVLKIYINGELDECTASNVKDILDKIILDNLSTQKVVMNLSGVSFMDSTGIGLLIGRYKKLQRYGIPMYVINPTLTADRILQMSGVYSLIPKA